MNAMHMSIRINIKQVSKGELILLTKYIINGKKKTNTNAKMMLRVFGFQLAVLFKLMIWIPTWSWSFIFQLNLYIIKLPKYAIGK